jgi:D-alanyl-D-alanine dipeptidase
MSATTSSKDGPLRNNISAHPRDLLRSRWCALVFSLALVSLSAPSGFAQSGEAKSGPLHDFVGTYKAQSSEKRVRVIEKDGRLIYESADGLTVALFHLVQSESGDAFRIEESTLTTRDQVKFTRDGAGNVSGLRFAGGTYVRLAARNDALSLAAATEPLRSPAPFPGQTPKNLPEDLKNQAGDFGNQDETDTFVLLERAGRIFLRDSAGTEHPMNPLAFVRKADRTSFTYASNETDAWVLAFEQYKSEPVWQVFTHLGPYHRLSYSVPAGSPGVVRVKPARPLAQIRTEALAAAPPEEKGKFRASDLVELTTLDRSIHLDIRYATSNDFLGMPVYTQARAFLQRPAAEALLRVLRKLAPLGYGLLIHDGYRPWYVTKIFWDATPADGKIFVADPSQGSRHNRGCAVDLTLYDLKTGQAVEMTGLYDEMSPRSFPDYPGGTTIERWHRDLLRWAMESEGFTVFESEWWHFDYKEWREYAIGNVPFEKLNVAKN